MNLYKHFSILAIAVLLVAISTGSATAQGIMIGADAPDFKLPGVDGKDHALKDYAKSDVLVVLFTCNHCPTSQEYEERIIKYVDDYKEKSVALVAISPNDPAALRLDEMGMSDLDDTFESMKLRAKDKKFNFPYLYDGDDQATAKAYGATVTPEVFIFDKDRKLQYRGRWDDSPEVDRVRKQDVRDATDAILDGEEITLDWTRPFGCSVKWSTKRESAVEALKRYADRPVYLDPITMKLVPAILANRSAIIRVVHVWSSEDKKHVEWLDRLVETERMYERHPMLVLTVNIDDPEKKAAMLELLKERQASCLNVQLLSDDETAVDRDALVEVIGEEKWKGKTPYTFMVAPGGEILWTKQGEFESLAFRRVLLKKIDELFGR